MEELEKKIAGDWFDIKENAENIHDLEEYFDLSTAQLRQLVQDIRLSVEEGIIEYKRNVLNPVLQFLESMQYDSRGFENLRRFSGQLTPLIYALLIQRLISRGTIPLRRPKAETEAVQKKEIKDILSDMNDIVEENPELNNHPAVRNIHNQMNFYKKELENMNKLAPNIPPEKKESFARNFKQTFDEIYTSIQENYQKIIQEEKQRIRDRIAVSPLTRHDIKPLAKLFFNQAAEIARVRSTLAFAAKEGFRTREALVRFIKNKKQITALFDEEAKRYREMAAGDEKAVRSLSKAFGNEIMGVLNRQLSHRSPQQQSQSDGNPGEN